MPPHIIIIGMPAPFMAIMRLQHSMNMSFEASLIGVISQTMPVAVILQVIMHIIAGIMPCIGIAPIIIGFIGMPPIIGIIPPIIGFIGIMLFIIGIGCICIAGFMICSVWLRDVPQRQAVDGGALRREIALRQHQFQAARRFPPLQRRKCPSHWKNALQPTFPMLNMPSK
ncbi:hypothetical protein [Mesorhizobium sp. AR02]|uniref:hypothetical protein n=1 Tax=Mesorhizobium sp. AR02 TaxID=2865837 RepID=UPI00215F2216|nr:hypothetical protein [Mesorhizobium sp. AR02]